MSEQNSWVRWKPSYEEEPYKGTSWLNNFRIKAFKILLIVSILLLLLIVARSLTNGVFPVLDFCNTVCFAILLFLLNKHPKLFKTLVWVGLVALFINALDGILPNSTKVIPNSYVLYPLLALYGGLLGEIWIAVAAIVFVLTVFLYTWITHRPLSYDEYMILTNLSLATFGMGVAGPAIWYTQKRTLQIVDKQARKLHSELDARIRLDAIIFHDINNPLFLMKGTTDLMLAQEPPCQFDVKDIQLLNDMTKRISTLIDSARGIGTPRDVLMHDIQIDALFAEQKELFAQKLADKKQTFILNAPEGLSVYANKDILRSSILSNFMSNAIKFSPSGSEITMTAKTEGAETRISIIDAGQGFPDDLLRKGEKGEKYQSTDGTNGEFGTAYGLLISSICLRNMNGFLEVRNGTKGGAEVSAILNSSIL